MPDNLPNTPLTTAQATNAGKVTGSGSKSKLFLSLMLAGTVAAAGGYALISKNQQDNGQALPSSGPFNPAETTDAAYDEKAKPKAVVVKAMPKKNTGAAATSGAATVASSETAAGASGETATEAESSAGTSASGAPVKVAATKAVNAEPQSPVTTVKIEARPRIAQAPGAQVQRVAGGWPEYRGPKRDGISRETGWFGDGEPELVWKANVGAGFSSVSVANGRAYAMGNSNNQDTIYCFDAATGKGVWKYSYPCDLMANSHEGGPSATPTVDGNMVYTYSKQGHLHAIDATNGQVAWKKDVVREMGGQIPQWGITSTPAVYGNALYVMTGAPNACVTAFDKKSGNILWKAGKSAPSYAALQVFDWKGAPYLAVFNAGGVEFMDVKNGKSLWSYPWKTEYDVNAAIPIIEGDKVFISSGYGTGAAMLQSTANNALLWKTRDMKNHFNASVLLNGYIYGFDESELTCLDMKSGRKMWSQGRLGKGSLIASDNKLIILSERGELVIAEANPQGFKELSRAQILGGKCWSAPSLANGRIYARNAQGDLVCAKF
ncbi:MAG TPA: PQQ-binding-like beta-propeller repeat protein [Abditibacteriaceae bacterium]|jgi:outer membrane protein assembly factor BamB